jgi:hypothetical protein
MADISGIKCDTPKCEWKDMSVKREEYPAYLNKPCPDCGGNLLTEADYNFILALEKAERISDRLLGWIPGKRRRYRYELNGTGKATVTKETK